MSHRRKKSGFFSLFGVNGRRRNFKGEGVKLPKLNLSLSPETKKGIFIILLFVFSALGFLGIFDLSGNFGRWINNFLAICLGGLKWLAPVLAAVLGYALLREEKYHVRFINYLGAILFVLGFSALMHLRYDYWISLAMAKEGLGGGYVGVALSLPLLKYMNFWGALVVCLAVFLIGLLLMLETSLYGLMWPLVVFKYLYQSARKAVGFVGKKMSQRKKESFAEGDYYEEEEAVTTIAETEGESGDYEKRTATNEAEEAPKFNRSAIGQDEKKASLPIKPKKFGKKIELPLNLLNNKSGKPTSGDIKANQEVIRKTLANFGIPVEMADVNIGPTVTQYTLRPAEGVKLSRIVNLNNDLALALAAHPIRIEAPIPNKSLVGIEIPNEAAAKVTMGDMLASKEFKERTNNLYLALGKDVSGKPLFAQLDKMPHLLIAGATGSGKSVCINSVIVSLLYQNSPDELKLILVDPKRVELPLYNNIPYLLTPVITDVKKTIGALKWCIVEMEKRFELLSKVGKRNIASYNQLATEKLPYIVFIIDELADLMAVAGNDMEAGIVRLAQMARAVGIHLILATQRPSVEVITGLIKANIPARIAFSVASLIDSRTILDASGAEKLVGRGDMLYLGPDISKPRRIQGVYLSDAEINNVVSFIKNQGQAEYVEELNGSASLGLAGGGAGFSDDEDALLPEAVEVIRQTGKASASLLQRRLKLGYARAARILDILEDRGIIGPVDGAKPREVFLENLGGVSPVEFAAREHGLEGELRPLDEEEEEEEPSYTAFTKDKNKDYIEEEAEQEIESGEPVAPPAELIEQAAEEENIEEEAEVETVFVAAAIGSDTETPEVEEPDQDEQLPEEEEAEEATDQKLKKKIFDEDEWT